MRTSPGLFPAKKYKENFVSSCKKPGGHGARSCFPPALEATGVLTPTGQFWPENRVFVARLL